MLKIAELVNLLLGFLPQKSILSILVIVGFIYFYSQDYFLNFEKTAKNTDYFIESTFLKLEEKIAHDKQDIKIADITTVLNICNDVKNGLYNVKIEISATCIKAQNLRNSLQLNYKNQ